MKHLNLFTVLLLLLFSAGAKAQFAWYGSKGVAQVETNITEGNGVDQGVWWVATDHADGGESKVVWDDGTVNSSPDDNLVKTYGGLSGTAVLDKGELDYSPMVYVGFNIAGLDSYHLPIPADVSAWGGIAIFYTCDVPASIELGLGDIDASIGYANPAYSLPSAPDGNFVRIPWSAFEQPAWYWNDTKISGPEAAEILCAIKFKIQAINNGSYHFKISAIGSLDMAESTTQSKLNITATGNGSAKYNSTTIRNTTKDFWVEKGTNAKVTFTPDAGYMIKSVKVGDTDVTSSVTSNSYTIKNIKNSKTLSVVFDAIPPEKCAKPTITYANGKLTFSSDTEDVDFVYEITNSDVKSGTVEGEVSLGNSKKVSTFKVSVYAKKDGCIDSDVATKQIKVSLLPGDVNNDGKVNAADVVKVTNIIMNN